MKWFNGSIGDAIQKSKKEKRIFIVYVTGQDEQSKSMDSVWEDKEVSDLCESEDCVALKVKANGEECGFFSQIYPVVTVPSSYFIAINGAPIEVTAGHVDAKAFCQVIHSVIRNHRGQIGAPSNQTSQPEASSDIMTSATQSTVSSAPDEPIDLRVEIVQQKVDENRLEKLRKEEEDRKQKEIERRKLGQDMAKLKEFQEEQKRKELQNKLAKERIEKMKERERIKQELENDRAERASKYRKDKEVQEKQKEERKQAKEMAQNEQNSEAEAKKRENARLQIRLPDGSSLTNVFPSSDTLQSVHNFVSERLGTSVTLSTTFPKRTFTEEDMSQTLLLLELVPSAVLIAVPGRRTIIASNPSDGGGVVSMVLAPFIAIWNFLYTFIFGSAAPQPEPSRAEATDSESSSAESSTQGARPKTGYQRRPIRSEGNVRRLTDIRDDDDENATWNGNSTQQM